MEIYICKVCGHIEFGTAPDVCPVCHAAKIAFQENNSIFEDSAKDNSEGIKKHTPYVITQKDALIEEGPSTDVKVCIGELLHPMLENHFIHFIDCDNNLNLCLLTESNRFFCLWHNTIISSDNKNN